jgi:N-acetylneuraminate synthase
MKLALDPSTALQSPTYFIADIAANHDGSLERALELIRLAASVGANAAKFQNFKAETIVSGKGFKDLGQKLTHQAKWDKDVFQVYKEAELPIEWTDALIAQCNQSGIDYFTAPYDLEFIDYFSSRMPYFKVGSGDITWKESLQRMAGFGKPVLLATGASDMDEIRAAVRLLEVAKVPLVLMQCNTNYTGQEDNFDFLNLLALEEFKREFPTAVLGLSDHSQGHVAVLGAVALGARAVEKHFTDDTSRTGPDHAFSLDPIMWKQMVDDTRILERTLGTGNKKVEENEQEARIVQRRSLRFAADFEKDHIISRDDLVALRPAPRESLSPFEIESVVGLKLQKSVIKHEIITRDIV